MIICKLNRYRIEKHMVIYARRFFLGVIKKFDEIRFYLTIWKDYGIFFVRLDIVLLGREIHTKFYFLIIYMDNGGVITSID